MSSFETALGEFPALFDEQFFSRWGMLCWAPSQPDIAAAAELHVQLISRVTTQPLIYRAGVEVAALKSIYDLFGIARDIATKFPMATIFDKMVWHVLNKDVRPFTAKWHRKSMAGALTALDETDEFRNDLAILQGKLVIFDLALVFLRDGVKEVVRPQPGETSETVEEMKRPLGFGIPILGELAKNQAEMNHAERVAILERRRHYDIPLSNEAAGLAISGGGIRSSTFALGVLVALSKRNLLPQFDFMSTVSGGGFVGSFITTYLAGNTDGSGLRRGQEPFAQPDGESDALRRIRHVSRYLQTSKWERLTLGMAQLYGMAVNIFALITIPLTVALLEYIIRHATVAVVIPSGWKVSLFVAVILAGAIVPGLMWHSDRLKRHVNKVYLTSGALIILMAFWEFLTLAHSGVRLLVEPVMGARALAAILAFLLLPISFAFCLSVFPIRFKLLRWALALVAGLAAPLSFLGVELGTFAWLESYPAVIHIFGRGLPLAPLYMTALIGSIYVLIWLPLDLNFTAPHRHYKRKLAEAFLIQRTPSGLQSVEILLSGSLSTKGPYHLINASLNVPASRNAEMQGRLTDFFLFSPAFCGSPVLGYHPTKEWEAADTGLSLATAMAISGAAASPLMGMATKLHLSFWLAILNVRLGYWAKRPGAESRKKAPGPELLGREMLGMIDEKGPYVNLTDGGHIENLGVYELIRRRCKFIVAIDGEFDPKMTFHALTNLQRLASIDLGVNLELDLDDLRLDEKNLSRSHFQLCRINYPAVAAMPAGTGYLLYIKLSLTGNEGEFIRRYRMDEPEFPHHSTSNQFFSEGQFEAYRSLGQHIGERLFVEALAGKTSDDTNLAIWFHEMGRRMLHEQ